MTILTTGQLTTIRQDCAKAFATVAYTKAQVNAALQAIEDTMVSRAITAGDVTLTIPQIIVREVNAATSPFVFTTTQKILLFALWARLKFERDK